MDAPDDVEQVIVSGDTTLETLLGQYSGEMYWAACRVVDLAAAGGKYLGVNDGQTELGGSDSSGSDGAWMQQWIAYFLSLDEAGRIEEWDKLDSEQRDGACLVDETVRQWYVSHTDAGSGVLNEGEMDGFLTWWGTASEAERNEAWGDLNPEQQEQVRQRYADTAPLTLNHPIRTGSGCGRHSGFGVLPRSLAAASRRTANDNWPSCTTAWAGSAPSQ